VQREHQPRAVFQIRSSPQHGGQIGALAKQRHLFRAQGTVHGEKRPVFPKPFTCAPVNFKLVIVVSATSWVHFFFVVVVVGAVDIVFAFAVAVAAVAAVFIFEIVPITPALLKPFPLLLLPPPSPPSLLLALSSPIFACCCVGAVVGLLQQHQRRLLLPLLPRAFD
jgi:hypothetical protein